MTSKAKIPLRFRPIDEVAYVTDRPMRTIRNWAARGRIERMEHPRTGMILVDLVAAQHLSEQTGRRNRAPVHAA